MTNKETYLKDHLPVIQFALNDYCSHRCWYCISRPTWKGSQTGLIDEIGLDAYSDKLIRLTSGRKGTFRFGGQEPTEHPLFYPLLLRLLETGNNIEIITNGLKLEDCIEESLSAYFGQIKWEMSFHAGVYMLDHVPDRFEKWIRSFKIAVQTGRVELIIPMTPYLLKHGNELNFDELRDSGEVTFDLIEFYCKLDFKNYPKDYSEAEKSMLEKLRAKYQKDYIPGEVGAICEINRILYLRGMPCYYMNRICNIDYKGQMRYCGSGFPAKFGKEFIIKDEASPCEYDSCNCISMGLEHCLKPNGLNYQTYLKRNNRPIKKNLIKKACTAIRKRIS